MTIRHAVRLSSLRRYGLALLLAALAVVVRWLLDRWLGDSLTPTTLFGPVALAVWIGGLRPAVLAAGVGFLASDYLFVSPPGGFGFETRHLIALATYLLSCAIVIGLVAMAMRAAHHRARASRERSEREAASAEPAAPSNQLAATILESITDAYYMLDREWRYTAINVHAERYFGRPRQEMLGRVVWEFFPETRGSVFDERYHEAMRERVPVHFEVMSPTTSRWVEIHAYPSDAGLSVFFRDITERKRVEREMSRLVQRVTSLVDNTPLGVVEWNADFVVTRWSGQAERVFGWTATEVVGTRIDALGMVYEEDQPKVEALIAQLRDPASRFVVSRNRNVTRNGEVVSCEWYNSVLHDEAGQMTAVLSLVLDVTEREQIEEQLRRRAEEVEKLIEFMPLAVGRADDPECRRITGNPTLHKLLHLPLGQNLSKSAPPEERPRTFRVLRDGREIPPDDLPMQYACRHAVEVRDAEIDIVYDSGESRHLYCYATPLFGETGQVRGCVFTALDITERKRMEDALRQAEERFRASQEASLFGFIILKSIRDGADRIVDFEFTYVNPAAAAIIHLSVVDLVGRKLSDVMPDSPDAREAYERTVRVVEKGEPFDSEVRYDGETFDKWYRHMTVKLEDGVAISLTDMTARKRAEMALEKRARTLDSLWDAARVLLTSQAPDTMLRELMARIGPHIGLDAYFNYVVNEVEGALQLASCFGISEDAARSIDRLELGQAGPDTLAVSRESLVVANIQQCDDPKLQWVRSLGVRAYVCNPLMASDRLLGMIAFASRSRDEFDDDELEFLHTVTHYMAFAYERLWLIDRLREADRRKDEFLATLAHELRNPLAPICNAVEVLKAQRAPDTDTRWSHELIERQVGRMARLLDDLLEVSRITHRKLELRKVPVVLATVVRDAIEASRPLIERGRHELSVTLPDEPLYLEADPVRLAQIFSNLLNNAAKYTEPGGRIQLTAERQENDVVVSVRDTGIGIAADMLPHVFEIFSQARPAVDRSQGGLGIGLSLVKGLVEMHGGRIRARSDGPDRGSEFIVRLPLAVAARAVQQDAPPARETRCTAGRRIVVADDNRDAADSLARLLEIRGYNVRVAYNGLEAVDLAAALHPDLVVLDIGMPVLDGYDAARRIREQPWSKDLILVAQTGWGQEEDKRRALEAGFDFHMVKPADAAELDQLLVGARARA